MGSFSINLSCKLNAQTLGMLSAEGLQFGLVVCKMSKTCLCHNVWLISRISGGTAQSNRHADSADTFQQPLCECLQPDLFLEAAAMGLDLPIRTFNGTDVLDSP